MGKIAQPQTVGSAKALGWSSIEVECLRGDCAGRHTSQIPWTMIPGGDERRLADIVPRLRCRHCRRNPTGVFLHRLVTDNQKGPPSSHRLALTYL